MKEIESIYKTYFNDVYRFLLKLSGNEHIAEEITSETFFKAIEGLEHFNGACDIRVWLCQIAKNSYFSYLRKNKMVVEEEQIEECETITDIEKSMLDAESSMKIHEILHNLEEPYKEVFSLRIFGELSFQQIARLFGKNANWACVTYYRAKSKIAEQMEEWK